MQIVNIRCEYFNTYREKARWELHKNATSNIEEILEAAPHESATVRPLTSHL